MMRARRLLAGFLAACLLLPSAFATWSIVAVDLETGEVAVGCATCLSGFDLERFVPVIVPEVGAAAAQSAIDAGGTNRQRIRGRLLDGLSPDEILDVLRVFDIGHQSRQYGIVDLQGRAASFTGRAAGAWAGGVTGQVGSIVYAIQGNVLTGSPVVDQAEQAFVNTPGDLAEKLMASMEAARAMGGDGRCSCSQSAPTSCGSPPQSFNKSAHVGFMIIARPGDALGLCNAFAGCATADYYMNLNVAGANPGQPDPVFTLRTNYDAWRNAQSGRPDGSRSLVFRSADAVPAGSTQMVDFILDLQDIDGVALGSGGHAVTVDHDGTSAGRATVQSIVDHQDGTYTITLQPGSEPGMDRFRIVVDDGVHPATIWPLPTLLHQPVAAAPLNELQAIAGLDTPALERQAFLLPDGLSAWFVSNRNGSGRQLMRATRAQPNAPFGPGVLVPGLNGGKPNYTDFWVSDDELHVVLSGYEPGSSIEALYESSRPTTADPFSFPKRIESLDSGAGDGGPWLNAERTEIVFHSRRAGGAGGRDLWRARRRADDAAWYEPQPITDVNTPGEENSPILVESGTRLLFSRAASGGREDLCHAPLTGDDEFAGDRPYPGAVHRSKRMNFTSFSADGSTAWIGRGGAGGVQDALQATASTNSLQANGSSVSAAAGGSIDMQLDAGTGWAGAAYAIVLSGSDRGPAASVLDAILPLHVDKLTRLSRRFANKAPYLGFQGHLDASGRATAQFQLAPNSNIDPSYLNRRYRAAFAARLNQRAFASNTIEFELLP